MDHHGTRTPAVIASARCAGTATRRRRWRLVAVDGMVFDVPDTEANADFFGRPGSGRGQRRSAYPQVRVAALVECGTHAVFAAATGPLSVHEQHLIPGLLDRLGPGMLVMADRGITGFELWRASSGTGADLLWRVRKKVVLPVLEQLGDGSYLSRIAAADDRARRDPAPAWVIEYTLEGGDSTVYRLITTVCDPDQAPAAELAAHYHQRGRSGTPSTRSKPTRAAANWSCVRNTRTASSRRSTNSSWSTMPSETSSTTPPTKRVSTRTGSPSPAP
ncbi:transposase [Streptomyces sp. NPDC056178]|uniref:transposase n=1 Tax=Streptomyces sp. NPDC056178 TaxID=3345735 RepID=UPI0035DCC570